MKDKEALKLFNSKIYHFHFNYYPIKENIDDEEINLVCMMKKLNLLYEEYLW